MTTTYRIQNPATGELLQKFPFATDDEIQQALTDSATAYTRWSSMKMSERGKILEKLADLFEENAVDLAAQATLEMGKNSREAIGEVKYCARIIRYYATEGERLTADQELKNIDGQTAVLRRKSLGPLLGIMPWNFPFYQVIRFAAPNLMLGNTVLLKHAEICAGTALTIQEYMHKAGVLEGAYINVFATHDQASTIIADPRIHGVSLTGSERAGSAVGEQAGRHLKKAVLELGGSDPYIVLDSTDVTTSARRALFSRLANSGQTCTSNKRMIIMDDIYDEFVAELTKLAAELTPGDPAEANRNEYAPLSSESAATGLMQQIDEARKAGANVLVGGERPDLPGYYVKPTVLTDIPESSKAFSEELFGPVVMAYRVATEDEAIELANSSVYGLGGSVFSTDEARAQQVADQLDVGMVHVNAFNVGGEDLPFGGVKRSGFGRELGPLGMDEFVNKQLLTLNTPR